MLARALAAFSFLFALATLPMARAADVAVVLSEKGNVYTEFATAFQQFSEGSNWRIRWIGSVENINATPRADLLVAVGMEAVYAALKQRSNTPLVATLVPRPAYERALINAGQNRPKGSITAVLLDQPVARLLAFTRIVLPGHQRVGLLASSETLPLLPQVRQAANTAGIKLELEEVESSANLVPAVNNLLSRSDVLLALPDSAVYRRDNIRAILLTSYRHQRPVIGFSQSLAISGALATIYSTPTQIARQTADLIRLQHPGTLSLPAPQAPTLFAIAINHNVAHSLGLTLPEESAIRRALAAEKDVK